MTVAIAPLPPLYKGDSYAFRLTFPDPSFLTGAPANVKAQVRAKPTSDDPDAIWTATVDGSSLLLSMAEVALEAGTYYTDVQVGSITYLRSVRIVVLQDVSR